MTSEEILNRVRDVVIDVLGEDDIVMDETTTAGDVDGWDSVSNMEVMIALEQEFGIRFNTGEMAALKNVGQLVERIALRLAGG